MPKIPLKSKIGKLVSKKPRLAVMVDGPNILRKDINLSLEKIKSRLEEIGSIRIAKVFLDQYASDKLIEAVTNQGFEGVITPTDVDVIMAVYSMEAVYSPHINTLVLVTRDADFQSVLKKAKEHGKDTIVVGAEPGFSTALKNTADKVIMMDQT